MFLTLTFFLLSFVYLNSQDLSNMEKKHGGKREGAGRKSKAEEFSLIEKLDSKKSPDWVIQKMFDHIDEGNFKAIELYMGYRYGKPKQVIEGDGLNSTINIPLVNWVSNEGKGIDFMDDFVDE